MAGSHGPIWESCWAARSFSSPARFSLTIRREAFSADEPRKCLRPQSVSRRKRKRNGIRHLHPQNDTNCAATGKSDPELFCNAGASIALRMVEAGKTDQLHCAMVPKEFDHEARCGLQRCVTSAEEKASLNATVSSTARSPNFVFATSNEIRSSHRSGG